MISLPSMPCDNFFCKRVLSIFCRFPSLVISGFFPFAVRFMLNPPFYYCFPQSNSPKSQIFVKLTFLFTFFSGIKLYICKWPNANLGVCWNESLCGSGRVIASIKSSSVQSMYRQMETGFSPLWKFSLPRSVTCMHVPRAAQTACSWELNFW